MSPPKKAQVKPAKGPAPKSQNTTGRIVNRTRPQPERQAPANPNASNYNKEFYDYLKDVKTPEQVKRQWSEVHKAKAAAEAAGDRPGVEAAKNAIEGLKEKANAMRMSVNDMPNVSLMSPEEAMTLGNAWDTEGDVLGKPALKRLANAFGRLRPAKSKGGGHVPARKAKLAKPRCFGGEQAKKNPAEYDRQLKQHEDGLNNMTVDEYMKNRSRWDQMKRAGTGAEQAKARADAIAEMARANSDALRKAGMSRAEAAVEGMKQAQNTAKSMDVLHSPDLSAGGSATGTTGLGDKGVNRSIGSNWGQNQDASKVGDRVRTMDESAKGVPPAERANTKMNVKLKRCP